MAKGGRRYPLVIYTHMIDRWWPAILAIGFALLGLSWGVYKLGFEQWRWLTFVSIGGLNIFIGIILLAIRKSAYIQPFSDHIRLVTPFLRLNISYKRYMRASSANMAALFPRKSISNWQFETIHPLIRRTALLIELTSYPMPLSTLRLFLSPLFFKVNEKTPNFVILVDDWMRLSTELESIRTSGQSGPAAPQPKRNNSILSRLPNKDQ